MSRGIIALLIAFISVFPARAQEVTVVVEKPLVRWLFGGFGFQHSEANFEALMTPEFRDQRVLKTFAELSPTFGRVYTGFAGQSKEQMDRFAGYYHKTFAKAGTILYAVPCALVYRAEDTTVVKPSQYAERVAQSLYYLIKEKECRKIRYYCLTNELMTGGRWGWFSSKGRMDLFKLWNIALYNSFKQHDLNLLLIGSDISGGHGTIPIQKWTADNMDAWLGAYVSHWYVYGKRADDMSQWSSYQDYFKQQVAIATAKSKRYILGEFGFCPVRGKSGVMIDDLGPSLRQPETIAEAALSKCEVGLAAMNAGAYGCISWSFVDYPEPFCWEDGNTENERAAYEAGLCAYKPDMKYNKWGLFHWNDIDRDYSATPELYCLGYMAKLFHKDATVLVCSPSDSLVRAGAVINRDRSVTFALINRGEEKTVTVDCSSWSGGIDSFSKSFRRYVYEADNPPLNEFNDLQSYSGKDDASGGKIRVVLPARSMTFLTTDYLDRTPEKVKGVRIADGKLVWKPVADEYHRYYRVYKDGKQIASTVATELELTSPGKGYTVKSIDAWGNE
ncbi:MAG: hypothetical protein IJL56_00480 [Bacteroidales bacterium]|nr:hypothetical protein [Bacteroidales bacterium]